MEIDINENKERVELYLKAKTFIFLREFSEGETSYYNGFVDEIKTDFIMFFDIDLKRTFPVQLDRFKVNVSAKVGVTEEDALKIYNKWKGEQE